MGGVVVQQKRELSLGRGGKVTQAPSPAPGTRVALPGAETLPIDGKVWGYICGSVAFREGHVSGWPGWLWSLSSGRQ